MALGSVSVPGMSKKTKERLMYMDGKLVWSAAMDASLAALRAEWGLADPDDTTPEAADAAEPEE